MIEYTGPHRRKNLLTGEWVLVSPHRSQRPWQGLTETAAVEKDKPYDESCYLCPGNARAKGQRNPDYSGAWSFDNDFPALMEQTGPPIEPREMLQHVPATGCCRVICFSERHDRHLVDMSVVELARVLRFIANEARVLADRTDIKYVQVFENRGQLMGCSNPHPHGQIWATSFVPDEPAKELQAQRSHWEANRRRQLLDYLQLEVALGERVIAGSASAVSVVPYWAVWPFETLLAPTEPASDFGDLGDTLLQDFAYVLRQTLSAYDRLFGVPMPYSMGFHPCPVDDAEHPEWQFHAHIYPPLLRSATIRKHMVGFEMLGMPQRDLTAETAAERLRSALQNG